MSAFSTDAITFPLPKPPTQAVAPWLLEDKWRLFPLAEGQLSLFPPDSIEKARGKEIGVADLLGEGPRTPVVVLGAPGMGLSTLSRWVRHAVSQEDRDALWSVDFAELKRTTNERDQAAGLDEMLARVTGAGSALGETDPALLVDHYLWRHDHQPWLDKPRCVLLNHVGALREDNAMRWFARLRQRSEGRGLDGPQTVILAPDANPLDTGPFSVFMSVCRLYRLADLRLPEVREMWFKWRPDPRRLDDKEADEAQVDQVAEACIGWTGGQPLLVQLYLGHLATTANDPDQAGLWLVEHPPKFVPSWQLQLAREVQGSRYLARRMRAYAGGRTESQVRHDELPLFLGGWIGPGPDGRWGIRSRAHAAWAKAPLRRPDRFLEVKR